MLCAALSRHVTFMPMIIGEIKRYLRDNNSIRVSRSVRDLAYKALQARDELSSRNNRDPDTEEIVKYLCENGTECKSEEVTFALEAIAEPVSLFDPVYNEANSSDTIYVMDQIKDSGTGEDVWLEDIALKEAMKKLSEREKSILGMRFFKGRTQMEIADEIGISQAQVSRLEKSALERIKKQLD